MKNEEPAPSGEGTFEESIDRRPEKSAEKEAAAQAGKKHISPPPLHGIHQWMMKAAYQGKKAGLSTEETVKAMYAHEEGARRLFQAREVEDAVEKAFKATVTARRRRSRTPKVAYNAKKAEQIYKEMPLVLENWSGASPVKNPETLAPEEVLRTLFADEETLVCAGISQFEFFTGFLEEHGDLSRHQFVVPGPMTARKGKTKDNPPRPSFHTKDNTGPRKFMVMDFDLPAPEWQPALIAHLTQFRSPALILSSGGKSLHAWFPVFRAPERSVLFGRLAVGIGADPIPLRNRSQFVRMPNGTRENGVKQSVIFFNPGPWRDDG